MNFFLLFLGVAIPLAWSPGPNNIVCALLGSRQKVKVSLFFILGLNIPVLVYAVLVGFGFSTLTQISPKIIPYISIFGAIYIIYLGWGLISRSVGVSTTPEVFSFKSALIISTLNFKTIAVLISIITTLGSNSLHSESDIMKVSFLFPFVCFIGHILWLGLGRIILNFDKNFKYIAAQNKIFGLLLIISGFYMVIP